MRAAQDNMLIYSSLNPVAGPNLILDQSDLLYSLPFEDALGVEDA
jgi:hypothetical protein